MRILLWKDTIVGGIKAQFDLEHDELILRRCNLHETKGQPRVGFSQFLDRKPPFDDVIGFVSPDSARRYQRLGLEAVAVHLRMTGHRPELLEWITAYLIKLDREN